MKQKGRAWSRRSTRGRSTWRICLSWSRSSACATRDCVSWLTRCTVPDQRISASCSPGAARKPSKSAPSATPPSQGCTTPSRALGTDGDADRIGVMDQRSDFVDQLRTFALLTYYLLEVRGLRGPIVKSVTTTSMVRSLGELYGVPVYETGVGFKYLGPRMIETDALIAGEESGGFAFRGHLPERDGILSGLYILDLMARRGKSMPELIEEVFAKVGPHYYDRIDITMTPAERDRIAAMLPELDPPEIAGLPVTGCDRTDGLRFLLDGGAWALIRLSGTEPLMRIYTEVRERNQVQPVLEAVRKLT